MTPSGKLCITLDYNRLISRTAELRPSAKGLLSKTRGDVFCH